MEVRFVGSGDAFGSGGRMQTCIRLQSNDFVALVDCGATTLTALRAQRLAPNDIDVIVLTHLHGDHFGGVPFLILDGQFTRRETPLTVLGPVGTAARLEAAMTVMFPGSATAPRRFGVHVHELGGNGDAHTTGPLTVRSWHVVHPSGAPALAIQARLGDRRFGYSGDTAWTEQLIRAAEGTDAFACEAYTFGRPVRYHLDYTTVQEHVAQLATRRLVLTHMGPSTLARLPEIDHETAFDGRVVQL